MFHGRCWTGAVSLVILAVNASIYTWAATPPDPIPLLQMLMLVSLPWLFAGAWGLCTRKGWGRAMMLGVLYLGSVAFLIGWIFSLTTELQEFGHCSTVLLLGMVGYVICSIALTTSKDVRRLTSRAQD